MRFFTSGAELVNETARELFSRGQQSNDLTRQGKIFNESANELFGYCYRLLPLCDLDEMFKEARQITGKDFIRREIAEKWFTEMFEDINPHTFWLMHPTLKDYFEKYCRELNGKESYTYGQRLNHMYFKMIGKITENPERRGAMLTVYNSELDLPNCGKRRIPCSTSYQPLIRKGPDGEYSVNLVYQQRSCDFVWFFTFDVYRAIRLLQKVTEDLNHLNVKCKPGVLLHFITSLHAYKSDIPDRWRW